MEEGRKKTPKKPENPVREWISDNLRYIMLFGGILVILVLTGLAVKLLSNKESENSTAQTQTKAESVAETGSTGDNQNDKDHMDTDKAEFEPSITYETENQETEKETNEANTETDATATTQEADSSMISNLIKKYFDGLSSRNPQQVASCVDSFTEEDAQQVAGNTQITSYKDIEVYTGDGIDKKSRVAFVSYRYTIAGSDVEIPALTQFYIYETGNGNWRLASDPSDAAIQQRMKELTQTEEVQAMISKVQEQYDQVMAEHPELQ